jgi:hypothetical protein
MLPPKLIPVEWREFIHSLPQTLNCFVILAEFDERDIER